MIFVYFLLALLVSGSLFFARTRRSVLLQTLVFLLMQAVFFIYAATHRGATEFRVFTYDSLGIVFFGVLVLLSFATLYHGTIYLNRENHRQFRLYHTAFVLLCATISGSYFANNITVSWILIEATTVGSAMLIYHSRSSRALEAAWKYVFVCSVGITVAYLGILFLSIMLKGSHEATMSYSSLRAAMVEGNPLYMKLAFVFILVGYSCKMEYFPLYSIGIDANHATPSPMSGFFSTAMINLGFVSLFRVCRIFSESGVSSWTQNVLLLTGGISLLVSSVYMLQVKHYKRLFAYSSVENMGIVLIALSLGSAGYVFAIFHVLMHSFVKSTVFYRLSQVGKLYGSYKVENIGGYWYFSRAGSLVLIFCMIGLAAIPPSALFVSELFTLKSLVSEGRYVVFTFVGILICVILYSLASNILHICYSSKPEGISTNSAPSEDKVAAAIQFALLVVFFFFGIYQPRYIIELLQSY
ncbi:MAG: hydrogenase 4 subunit F [Prevotellaceae bacterium]|jgi:hydrogenase-4 component F|nr:hydrogenase 4 subunit F [Prevotellaceae bacterium]